MAIHYTTTVTDGILRVKSSGFDESLAEVQQYGMAVIAACVQTGVSRVLCDELELQYRLSTVDTYLAAEFIAANAPSVAQVALVCNPAQIADARFWETVAVNRGLSVRAFRDTDSAMAWLTPPADPPAAGN